MVSLQDTLYETEQGLKLTQTENRRLLDLVNNLKDQAAKLDYELKLKTIDATDVSILKDQLRESTANVKQLEIYRDSLTREDKNKEQRLAELRKSLEIQNRIIEDLRSQLDASSREAAKIPDMLLQYRKLEETNAKLKQELDELRQSLKTITTPAVKDVIP